MKELNLEEIQQIQLSVLQRVAQFCEQKNITYFLCGGTLLGAIRHSGFIPWDDDIDIMMPRPCYERFLKEFEFENLSIYHYKRTKNYDYPFIKIGDQRTFLRETYIKKKIDMGIFIDIFPIDGFPDEIKDINLHVKRLRKLRRIILWKMFRFSNRLDTYKKLMFSILRFIIPVKAMNRKLNKEAKKYKYEISSEVGIAIWGYGIREVCPKVVFTETIAVEFEGNNFKAPKDYHTYLTNVYGNYMKLPPIEERKAKHHYIVGIKKGFDYDQIVKYDY